MTGGKLLKAHEVAELLDVSPATVLDWWQAGRLPGFRVGGGARGKVRFRETEIEATLESWRRGPGAAADAEDAQRGPRQLRAIEG